MPRIIELYYDVNAQYLFNPTTGVKLKTTELPWVRFREKPIVNLHLCTDTNQTAYTGLGATWAFSAAIDNDWDHATDPMVKTLDGRFNQVGEWGSSGTADVAQGQLSFVLDANTEEFEAEVDAALTGEIKHTRLEIKAYDTAPDLVWSESFTFRCFNLLDDDGSTTPATPSNYYTKTEADAKFSGLSRVADFAALPSSPSDLDSVYVTSVSAEVIYDAADAAWYYRGTSVEFTAADEA